MFIFIIHLQFEFFLLTHEKLRFLEKAQVALPAAAKPVDLQPDIVMLSARF
ncbi:MAG: hypothetical protein M0Z50_09715 [Planctomycetia bacterium]|nr:hypothetical protein [Planctomycetia bacterium]